MAGFRVEAADPAEIDELVLAAIRAESNEERARSVARGLFADETGFMEELTRVAGSGWPRAVEAHALASTLSWNWLMGARITESDDEPYRRLAAARALVARKGADHASFNAWITAVPILELPEGHPERDADLAHEILLSHLEICRRRGDADGQIRAITAIVRYALEPNARTEELVAEGEALRGVVDDERARDAFDRVAAEPGARSAGSGPFVLGRPLLTTEQEEQLERVREVETLRGVTDGRLERFLAAWRTTRGLSADQLAALPHGPLAEEAAFVAELGLSDEAARLAVALDARRAAGSSAGGPAGVLRLADEVAAGSFSGNSVALMQELGLDDDDLLGVCLFGLCDEKRRPTSGSMMLLNLVGLATADSSLGVRLLWTATRIIRAQGNTDTALQLLELGCERLGDGTNNVLLAELLSECASFLGELARLHESLARGREAALLARQAGSARVAAAADLNVAAALLALGRRVECAEILTALESQLEALGEERALDVLRLNREALVRYRQAEATPAFVADDVLSRFLADAEEYARRDEPDERLALLREATRQAATLEPSAMTVAATREYAAALFETGAAEPVLEALAGAAEQAAALALSGEEAALRLLEGRALLAKRDHAAAAAALSAARKRADEAADEELAAAAALALACAEGARGKLERAAMELTDATAALQRGGGALKAAEVEQVFLELEQATASAPMGEEQLSLRAALGAACVGWHVATGEPVDVGRALEHLRAAAGGTGANDKRRAHRLHLLGTALVSASMRAEEPALLDEGVAALESSLRLLDDSEPELGSLVNLATALRLRHGKLRDRHDLDRAIGLLEPFTGDAPAHAPAWLELGHLLRARFARDGLLSDLDRALELYDLTAAQPDLPLPPHAALSALGNGLRDRYLRSQQRPDIDRAIEKHRAAETLLAPENPERPVVLTNLATALRDRYQLLLADPDVTTALRALEEAEALSASLGGDRRTAVLVVGPLPADDAQLLVEDMDAAVQTLEEAAAAFAPDSPVRGACLTTLGICYLDRFERAGHPADLAAAVERCREAVEAAGPGSTKRPLYLNNLANCLVTAAAAKRERGDFEEAFAAYREACRAGLKSGPDMTLLAAGNWDLWAGRGGDWSAATEANGYALQALDLLFRTQLTREHKEAWLHAAQGLPARAARASARARDPRGAVESFEKGRALLLAEALDLLRAELEQLALAGREDLKTRYAAAAERWNDLTRAPVAEGAVGQGAAGAAALKDARRELDEAVEEIRSVPGFDDFLAPLTFARIVEAAGTSALAYLGAARDGGVATIVRPEDDSATPVWLPELTEEAVHERVTLFQAAYAAREEDGAAWRAELDAVTAWLWDAALGPLLDGLGRAPRVQIVPGGLLALLPLHAAWTPDESAPTGRRYALDGPVPTFAPSARGLAAARKVAESVEPRILVAVDEPRPQPAGVQPLEYSSLEVESAAVGFAAPIVLSHERATADAVLSALRGADVFHLSCHGRAEPQDPLRSHLLMARGTPLTLAEILATRLRARLGVLSACETAVAGELLPDEAVSLPTGLIQAGAGGVVGSLWSVPERATALLLVRFYQLWLGEDRLDPPLALREAQRWIRDTTNARKVNDLAVYLPGTKSRLASRAAEALWRELVLAEPDVREHEHPYYWAAFAYVGA